MRLKSGHCRSGVIQNYEGNIRPVMLGVNESRNYRVIKSGIAAKRQNWFIQAKSGKFGKPAGQACARTHGMKRTHGIKTNRRKKRRHRVTTDIAADNAFTAIQF